jgi:hypothetical protein
MSVDCIEIHTVRRKRIDGMKVDEFVERYEHSKVYLIDVDPHLGREMNFKVYRELSGIYDMWIDAAPRKVEDVVDVLISDAEIAIITGAHFRDSYEEVLEIAENVALRSIYPNEVNAFIRAGGKIVILPRNIIEGIDAETRYVIGSREVCRWRN